jgi:hypothetical protein
MIKPRFLSPVFFLPAFLLSNQLFAQQDTVVKQEKHFKNTVRFNITNPLIFGGKTLILGYERTLGDHQSICIDGGPLTLPKLLPGTINVNDSIQLASNSTEKGYHLSAEYRFYLKNENKYNSPRGVYLAPYVSYNYFNRKNTWTLNTVKANGDVTTDFTLTVATLGGELGYQFVLWKRVAIDLILIGPGMAKYSIKTKLDTTLDPDDETALFKKINDRLADKIPGYSLVIDDTEYETKGTTNTTSIGFRYMINLGFRF